MRVAALGACLVLASAALLGAQEPPSRSVAREIESRIDVLRRVGRVDLGASTVARSDVLLVLYERSGYAPLWTEAATRELIHALEEVRGDGLDPTHYHVDALAASGAAPRAPVRAAQAELLATDALLRVAHDLRFGKVEPSGPTTARGPTSPFGGADAAADVQNVIQGGRIREALRTLRPHHFVYQGLVHALADLRTVEQAGGWPRIPDGPALRKGSTDTRIPLLRRRLRVSGDLTAEVGADGTVFDALLEEAVRKFQHRHGLNEDGIVGRATLAEMNVPVETRIEQLRINLERARWVTHGLPDTFVAVNVAGARVYFVRAGQVVFESRAIVGKSYTRTPVFSAPMRYIDLNPTWTVPPGIVGEVLARVKKEPGYLEKEGMRVLDGGTPVDPAAIDFSSYSARSFPYVFRQEPGPANPLGQIKFVFPNENNVYLHDTPTRSLFEREERLFSHGCIRVENPLRLAELVLDDSVVWSSARIESAIATGETRTIRLERSLPVLILYWTASTDLDGELHFYRDVYERDAELLAALKRR